MEDIQELPFVFVDPFDLHIEKGIRIHPQADLAEHVPGQALLIVPFGLPPDFPEFGVLRQGFESA